MILIPHKARNAPARRETSLLIVWNTDGHKPIHTRLRLAGEKEEGRRGGGGGGGGEGGEGGETLMKNWRRFAHGPLRVVP